MSNRTLGCHIHNKTEVHYDIEIDHDQGLCYPPSRRLRWITQTEALIIPTTIRKPNSIIVLLYIPMVERYYSIVYIIEKPSFQFKAYFCAYFFVLNSGKYSNVWMTSVHPLYVITILFHQIFCLFTVAKPLKEHFVYAFTNIGFSRAFSKTNQSNHW